MILYDRLWETMKAQKVTTYTLREVYGIDSRTIRRLRANQNLNISTLDNLCRILNCRLEDIVEYRPD